MEGQVTDLRSLKKILTCLAINFPLSAALVAPAKFQYVHFHLPQSKMGKPKRTFWPAPVPLDPFVLCLLPAKSLPSSLDLSGCTLQSLCKAVGGDRHKPYDTWSPKTKQAGRQNGKLTQWVRKHLRHGTLSLLCPTHQRRRYDQTSLGTWVRIGESSMTSPFYQIPTSRTKFQNI